jgi:long-subunit acyl-CoA synthetase (AMP-forming)
MFSPMFLENKLKFSPYIKEAVIFGDQRDYVPALINIDPIVVGKWAEDRGISFTTYMDLSAKPEVAKLIQSRSPKSTAMPKKTIYHQTFCDSYTSCWTWMTAN